MLKHIDGVLRDAGADKVKLTPLSPELREVANDSGVAKQALHFINVEPGGNAALEVVIHTVAHGL